MSKNSAIQNIEAFLNWAGNTKLREKSDKTRGRIYPKNDFLSNIDPLHSTYSY